MNYFRFKITCLSLITGLLLFFAVTVQAQTARDNYNNARTALEDGNTSGCLTYLQRCESLLGGSNVRIEALKAQCFAQMDEWVKARIAFRNYDAMLDVAERGGSTYEQMQQLGTEIEAGLHRQEEELKKKKEEEQLANLKVVEEEILTNSTLKEQKTTSINKKNSSYLYQAAIETRDAYALELYKEQAATFSEKNQLKSVETELNKKKNPDQFLVDAVSNGDKKEVKYLIGLGGNINLKNSEGNSLLHLTVENENFEMYKLLVGLNADREIRNTNYDTPILYAIRKKKNLFVEQLADDGVDINVKNYNELNVLHYALLYNKSERVVSLLLKKGIDPNVSFKYRDTTISPLYYAVKELRSTSMAELLISNGAKVDEGKSGWSPLMAAVYYKDREMVKCLLKNKATINYKGIYGWTPLHIAARENNGELIVELLKAGADKDIKDIWGRTAKKVAYENETLQSLKALRRRI